MEGRWIGCERSGFMATDTTHPHDRTLTPDERPRIGAKLKGLRVERRLDQVDIARMADVSLGTIQMLERGTGRNVRWENLEKVAKALETSLAQLRTPATGGRPDPLLADLNQEDIAIARAFHRAITDVRNAVVHMLAPIPEREAVTYARLVIAVLQLERSSLRDLIDVVAGMPAASTSVTWKKPKKGGVNGR
jgi:transcriptional regulator with XRE-family HTH domain